MANRTRTPAEAQHRHAADHLENFEVRNFKRQKPSSHETTDREAAWLAKCKNEAAELYAKVLAGSILPVLNYGDWLQKQYDAKPSKKAWKAACKANVFGADYTVINRFMHIAKCEYIRNPENWPFLPHGWNGLWEITKLTAREFEFGKTSRLLHSIKSIRSLRQRLKKKNTKPGEGSEEDPHDDQRSDFGPTDEPLIGFDLDLTGPYPLSVGGEGGKDALRHLRNEIRRLLHLCTETREQFRWAAKGDTL